MIKIIILFTLLCSNSLLYAKDNFFENENVEPSWKIKKLIWTDIDEKNYSEFVSLIGQAVEKRECNSLQSCLAHKNNPYRNTDTTQFKVFADCAKLSFILRGYFAWKNGLPFGYSSAVKLRDVPGNEKDLRYSKHGNTISERKNILPKLKSNGRYELTNGFEILTKVLPNSVYSAHFRTLYSEDDDSETLYSDFYSADISRDGIKPGTNIYDPNGHVAIVYKITHDGKIYFIDAHPDNSLTSGLYGTKFVRSKPSHGAGFKNFRPIQLRDSQFDSTLDSYVGGNIYALKNDELKNFSAVQYFGTNQVPVDDWKSGEFIFEGQKVDYYQFIRLKLSLGQLKLNPINEIQSLTADLCQSLQDRIESVNSALKAQIHTKNHPERLPTNIYGTSGEWEEFSTPSRDARFKTSFKELRDSTENILNLYKIGDPQIDYSGEDIKSDMLKSYLNGAENCKVNYINSDKKNVSLNLEQIRKRLFELSFDPYMCVELRWGATTPDELKSCKDNTTKLEWHKALKWLRYQTDRKYDARMDYTAKELIQAPLPNVGVQNPPDIDIIKLLSASKK